MTNRSKRIKPNLQQFNRNLGFISMADHKYLQKSTVAIAGAGGDGGELAITLAQLGVGKFRIADPEVFEIDNLNRQTGASFQTIGQNKAVVISRMIRDINPNADVKTFTQGITIGNVEKFVAGVDLVIDETEYSQPELGVMLARASRKHNLPVLMALNVGFGSYTTSFSPTGMTFESYMGLDSKMTLEQIAQTTIPLFRWVPHVPSYVDMTIFQKVADREVSTPTVSPGVKMAAADASMQALAHLLKPISPQRARWIHYAPRGKSVDVIDGVANIRFRQIHFYKSVAVALVRTKLGKNPPAGY